MQSQSQSQSQEKSKKERTAKEKSAKEKTMKEKSVKEKTVKEKTVKEKFNEVADGGGDNMQGSDEEAPKELVEKTVPKSVNLGIVHTQVKSLQISKKVVYNEAEEVIGKIAHTPRVPEFAFHTVNGGKDWKKVWLNDDIIKEGGALAVEAVGIGKAVITTLASGWKFSTDDFGATWVRMSKKPEVAEEDMKPQPKVRAPPPAATLVESLPPLKPTSQKKRRKKRKILLTVPEQIPTPPTAPSIMRCVTFKVDALTRIVKAHFYPPFNDLFKAPQSDQKIKDKALILEYVRSVMGTEDVTWIPSGVAQVTSNPWSNDRGVQVGSKKAADNNDAKLSIGVCSICNGHEKDHSNCIRSFSLARHGMAEEIVF